jgi:hypothetical protein
MTTAAAALGPARAMGQITPPPALTSLLLNTHSYERCAHGLSTAVQLLADFA